MFLYLIGFSVFFGSLYLVWKSNAWRWNRLASQYANQVDSPIVAEKKLQQIILVGEGVAYNAYMGITRVGISEIGLSLSLLPPFSIFHPPLLIPFEDMLIEPTSWYLNCTSYKICTARVPQIEIIVDGKLKSWIATNLRGFQFGTNGVVEPESNIST